MTTLETLAAVAGATLTLSALIAGLVTFMARWFLGPWVDARIDVKIGVHEVRVRNEMHRAENLFTGRTDFETEKAITTAWRDHQEETNQNLLGFIAEIQRDIKTLLARR
ncbi:MAG TPA: hypothetical protein DCQ64_12510 [Candidatus Rokubacteria bacterium]|nr:hypothetical protein [Candidatus Rokubacteria bacterium]